MKPAFVLASTLLLAFAAPLFGEWDGCSIGQNGQSTIETYSANSFAITVTGAPLAGQADTLGFVSGPGKLNGDCEMVARLTKISPGQQEWAAGGVMMRDNLGDGSKFIAAACTREHGVQVFLRDKDDAEIVRQQDCSDCTPPLWLKITRAGNHFVVSKSNDGIVWLQIYQSDLAMKKSAWVGTFATNGGGRESAVITFDRLSARETGSQP